MYKVGDPYEIGGVWYWPKEDFAYDETGIASWYGKDFHGKYTANGEIFDLNALSAAHRTLPMPSVVEVTNLENGRSAVLRVNDRGPYARGRIIDVSRRGAQLLGFEGQGTAKVRVKILKAESIQAANLAGRNGGGLLAAAEMPVEPLAPASGMRLAAAPPFGTGFVPSALPGQVKLVPVRATQIYIQVGAFSHADNALRAKSRVDHLGSALISQVNGNGLYRVRLGPIGSVKEADRLLDRVVGTGLTEARIIVD
jgi:rare lipoprotein A